MKRSFHTVRQVYWHLRARPSEPPEWLAPAEVELYRRMAAPDQFEGLAVAETLRGWGYAEDRDLMAAAVLHDVGKSETSSWLGYRVGLTVLQKSPLRLLDWMSRRNRAIAVLAQHAAAGGYLAARAGVSSEVVALIRDHHQPAGDNQRLLALQRADALH